MIALSVTFLTDVVSRVESGERLLLLVSWLVLLLSVTFGVLTLMGISGALHCIENADDERCTKLQTPVTIYSWNIRVWSILQLTSFAGGLLMLVIFGAVTA